MFHCVECMAMTIAVNIVCEITANLVSIWWRCTFEEVFFFTLKKINKTLFSFSIIKIIFYNQLNSIHFDGLFKYFRLFTMCKNGHYEQLMSVSFEVCISWH